NLDERRLLVAKMLYEIFVYDLRSTVSAYAKRNAQHNITVAFGRIENARPVRESAVFVFQHHHFFCAPVETADRRDRLGNFLTISSDILNRRPADKPWNAAQALDAGNIILD